MSTDPGQIFREAWISGVRRHYPGEPKPSYVAAWPDLPEWQRRTDCDIFDAIESADGQ